MDSLFHGFGKKVTFYSEEQDLEDAITQQGLWRFDETKSEYDNDDQVDPNEEHQHDHDHFEEAKFRIVVTVEQAGYTKQDEEDYYNEGNDESMDSLSDNHDQLKNDNDIIYFQD